MSNIAKKLKLKSSWQLCVMMLPPVLFLVVFNYIPMVGFVIAFQDYMPTKGFFGSPWIGLEHFRYLFKLPDVYQVAKNTVIIALFKIIVTQSLALFVALLLHELRSKLFKGVVQSLFLFPYFLSWVILGGIFIDVLSERGAYGALMNMIGQPPAFLLGDPNFFRPTMIITHAWKDFGYTMVILVAALSSIDPNLYEAAAIDGANRWKRLLHVTLPGIMPTIILLVVLAVGGILNAGFEQILMMYNSLVYKTGDIVDTLVYRLGFESGQYSLATAVGLIKSIIGLTLILLSNWMAGKFANYRVL